MRVSDVRGFQGEDFKYTMTIRPRRPDFKLTIGGFADGVPKGSGREFNVKAERLDDFEGPIRIDITDVPEGFHVTAPLTIEAGQLMAFGAIYTGTDTAMPENDFAIVTATATINGKEVTHNIGKLGNIKPIDKPKLLVQVTTNESGAARTGTTTDPLEFTIAPGETISARVRVKRNGFNSRVELGSHDAGRNLPHGVYVDNIGLNGLLIVEGQTEREFFITADDWVPETTKRFHIRSHGRKRHCFQSSHPARPEEVKQSRLISSGVARMGTIAMMELKRYYSRTFEMSLSFKILRIHIATFDAENFNGFRVIPPS